MKLTGQKLQDYGVVDLRTPEFKKHTYSYVAYEYAITLVYVLIAQKVNSSVINFVACSKQSMPSF